MNVLRTPDERFEDLADWPAALLLVASSALLYTAGMVLSRICSSKPELVQRDWPGCAVDADPMQTLHHPEVDLVVIATPNDSHAPLATAALRAGKHVVVEKPMATTLVDLVDSLAVISRDTTRRLFFGWLLR